MLWPMPGGNSPISEEREASLFRNGRSQAVRIPREFEFAGDKVVIRKEGERLVIEPKRQSSLLEWMASRKPFDPSDDPFADGDPFDVDDPPPEPVDL